MCVLCPFFKGRNASWSSRHDGQAAKFPQIGFFGGVGEAKARARWGWGLPRARGKGLSAAELSDVGWHFHSRALRHSPPWVLEGLGICFSVCLEIAFIYLPPRLTLLGSAQLVNLS